MPHRSDIRFSGSARAEGAAHCSAGTGFVRYLACAGLVRSSAHVAPGRPGPRSVRKRGPASQYRECRVRRSAGIVLLCERRQSAYDGKSIAGSRAGSSYGVRVRRFEKCLNPRALNTRLGAQDKRGAASGPQAVVFLRGFAPHIQTACRRTSPRELIYGSFSSGSWSCKRVRP